MAGLAPVRVGRALLLLAIWLAALLALLASPVQARALPGPAPVTDCTGDLSSLASSDACTAEAELLEPLLPDLIPLPPDDLVITGSVSSGTRLLRLSTSFANLGPGRLELRGDSDPEMLKTAVTQYLYGSAGNPVSNRPAGVFIFHPTHQHWHMEDFTYYELWTLDSRGLPGEIVAVTGKVSFCLRDNSRYRGAAASQSRYYQCGIALQGISPGWVDTYTYDTPGQIINIAGLPDGLYSLRMVVDPLDHLLEASNANNTVREIIQITGRKVEVMTDSSEVKTILAETFRQRGEIP